MKVKLRKFYNNKFYKPRHFKDTSQSYIVCFKTIGPKINANTMHNGFYVFNKNFWVDVDECYGYRNEDVTHWIYDK